MKPSIGIGLLGAFALSYLPCPQPLVAQSCQDEEAMVTDYQKTISDLVGTVQKEKLDEFQRAYHQKSFMTKLTLCIPVIDGLVGCLDKASQDATATKEEVEAYKAKRDRYAKLKGVAGEDQKLLKAAGTPKEAKALIEKIDLSK